MKAIAETLALSMWLHAYGAHILFIEVVSLWLGSATEDAFTAGTVTPSDKIQANLDFGDDIRILYSNKNPFFSQNSDNPDRYNGFYAVHELGYDLQQIESLKPEHSWTFDTLVGGFMERSVIRKIMSWQDLLRDYWNKLKSNSGVEKYGRNIAINFQNFKDLPQLAPMAG